MDNIIPIAKPYISQELVDSVVGTLKSGMWARGSKCEQFERNFASYIGTNDAFAVNSGTTALRLAIRALDIPKGAKIIIPDMSFIATAQAVVLEGFEPVFVDVRQNGNLDPDGLEKSYSEDVKALLIVHLHGQTVDVERIAQFCHKHGLRLIEDASQATGASFLGGKVGSFGNISAFSLYATKNLTTGEGGIITFNDPALRRRLSIYSNNGFYQGEIEEPIGDSFRMSDIHASIGIYYLNHLDELNSKRREIAKYYSERIRKLSMLILPSPENNVFHHYNILVKRDFPFLFQKAHLFFHEKGIRIKQYYPYTLSSLLKSNSSKTASFLTKNTFSIPIYPSLQEDEIKKVADAVIDYFGGIKS